jgi:hypothetical protein
MFNTNSRKRSPLPKQYILHSQIQSISILAAIDTQEELGTKKYPQEKYYEIRVQNSFHLCSNDFDYVIAVYGPG